MKQEIITYLNTIEKELVELTNFLYAHPEESFHEYKAYDYIVDLLKRNDFNIKEHFLDIPTAFFAQYGNGHPKICYFCEYDAMPNTGHISGHNLISSMSLGAALSLSKVLPKTGGSVIVLGCPGEYINGAKITMAKQGTFSDIDVALMAHPNTITCESGSSFAVLPLKIEYKSKKGFTYSSTNGYSALDACLFTFNALNTLTKGFEKDCSIDGVIVNGGSLPNVLPSDAQSNFYIRAPKMNYAIDIEKKIRELVKTTSFLMNVDGKVTLYELPYEELVPNPTLSRIFTHNLKESGIIDIDESTCCFSGLSLGTVSHIVPCIHPYISIVEDKDIVFPSEEFGKATLSSFAQDKMIKTCQSLAFTGLDLIEKESLLKEVKLEFFNQTKRG